MTNKKDVTDFIARARKVHGNKYQYDRVDYKGANTKVTIVCPLHGSFPQTPNSHLQGCGCRLCYHLQRRGAPSEFIAKAQAIHGDTYDYSDTCYFNARTKVTISCRIHGAFQQSPGIHLNGHGCYQCGRDAIGPKLVGKRNLTTHEFVAKSIKRHGERYDYSATRYVNAISKVQIVCRLHGAFEQDPSSHLNGCGCPECANDARSVKRSLDTATFIRYSQETHGDCYDYSKANYVAAILPITIICRVHGPFEMLPYAHYWNGSGCPECSKSRVADAKRMTREEFILKAKDVHGDRYSYTKVEYVSSITDVTIVCALHGDFQQRPANHIHGRNGCPWCARTLLVATDEEMKNLPAFIYVLRIRSDKDREKFIKVGITQSNVDVRFRYKQYNHLTIEPIVIRSATLYQAWSLEALIHSTLRSRRFTPRTWFDGATECYREDALSDILEMVAR